MRTSTTGDLIAVYDRPYGAFTGRDGKTVEAGHTYWGVVFVGADVEPLTFKIHRNDLQSVRGYTGKRVDVEARPFAKGNQIEFQLESIALAAKAAA